MTKDELRVYLAEIMKLETERYEISLAVSQLEKEKNVYRQIADKPPSEEQREKRWTKGLWKEIWKSSFVAGLAGVMTGFAGRVFVDYLPWLADIRKPLTAEISIVWGFISFFLVTFAVMILYACEKIYVYNKAARRHNQERVGRNKMILEESWDARKRIRLLDGEMTRLLDGYRKAERRLGELYSRDVIYSKYQTFAPVSRFYEYLSSGRCSRLEGYDGAYNLYEKELMAESIRDSLECAREDEKDGFSGLTLEEQ